MGSRILLELRGGEKVEEKVGGEGKGRGGEREIKGEK